MGTRGTGRRRSMKKEKTTGEEEALTLVSAQAEAKLAAKRAARAEAREIRLQELERRQREVDDKDYSDGGSGPPLTPASPLDGTSHPLGDGDMCVDNGSSSSSQKNQGFLAGVEEKYRQAMVSNAQLYNEKNQLLYVVDVLKDSLLELEELLSESRREYEDKVKEHEQEKQAHRLLKLQFSEMKDSLKQHQELLNELQQLRSKEAASVLDISDRHDTKVQALERQEFAEENRLECNERREDVQKEHGVTLKPSLSINAAVGSPAAVGSVDVEQEAERRPADETELRSSREDDVDLQHQQDKPQNAEEPLWSSGRLQEQESAPPEEPNLSTEGDGSLAVDSTVAVCSSAGRVGSRPQEAVTSEDGDVPPTDVPSVGNTREKEETSQILQEEQKPKQPNVGEALQPVPTESNSGPQQNPQNSQQLEKDEGVEEAPNIPKSSTSSGKKKKKKRGKKKGGSHDNQSQQKAGAGKEAGANKEEADTKDVTNTLKSQSEDEKESGPSDASLMIASRFPNQTLPEASVDRGEDEEAAGGEAATATFPQDEDKTEGPANAGTLAEGSPLIDTVTDSTTDPTSADPEDNLTLETEMVREEEPAVSCSDQKELKPALEVPEADGKNSSDLSHFSAEESESTSSTQSSVLPPKDDGAEASSSSEPRPHKSPGVTGSEEGLEGVGGGDGEAENEGEGISRRVTSDSHDEDSALPEQSQEPKHTEGAGRDGGSAELDPPAQTEEACASSELERRPSRTCHHVGADATPGGAGALALEAEDKPKLENDQHHLEPESSASHSAEERANACGGGPEEEDGEDEEGRPFDFDYTELELAAVRNPSQDPEWGETSQVTADDVNEFKLSQSQEKRQKEPSESDGFRDTGSDSVGQEEPNSSPASEKTPEPFEDTSRKQKHQTYEVIEAAETQKFHAASTKKLTGSADGEDHTASSATGTDVDPVRMKDGDFPKLSEQAGGGSEESLEGKEAKKSSRKGKGKSKEECKMS
uniref:Leucine rich repeat (in FLII) interacting protein 1a n=1 Tax=Oryzias latipes TaxID=8090 RepID=A0A3P9LKS1_ORYLA